MNIRPILPTDDPLAVSRVYEESWKSAYRGIIPDDYLDSIPAGRWAAVGRDDPAYRIFLWVLEENARARHFYEKRGFTPSGAAMETEIGGKIVREVQYTRIV